MQGCDRDLVGPAIPHIFFSGSCQKFRALNNSRYYSIFLEYKYGTLLWRRSLNIFISWRQWGIESVYREWRNSQVLKA